MADPFEAENDDEWSQWFDALHEYHKAKVIKAVTGASNEFRLETSNITHLPHRSWCLICVKARGKENPHFKKNKERVNQKPTVSFDYKAFGQEAVEDDKVCCIVLRDNSTKTTYSYV